MNKIPLDKCTTMCVVQTLIKETSLMRLYSMVSAFLHAPLAKYHSIT